jgi:hypothetical protein
MKTEQLLIAMTLFLLVGVGTASAAIVQSDVVVWQDYTDGSGSTVTDSSANGLDSTLVNNPLWITFPVTSVSGAVDYTAADSDYEYIPDTSLLTFGNGVSDSPFTIARWVNITSSSSNQFIATKGFNGGDREYTIFVTSGNILQFILYDGTAANTINCVGTSSVGTGVKQITATYDGSGSNTGLTLYVDGSPHACTAGGGGSYTAMDDTTADFTGGKFFDGSTSYSNVDLGQLVILNKEASSSEVNDLYDSGNGLSYPFGTTNFEITAKDSYTTSSLNNFSALIDGTTYSTTNGTITTDILDNSTSLYNITMSSNESGGYFNRTYTDYNVSSNLQAGLHQAEISFTANNRVSGASVNNFTVTAPNGNTNTAINPSLNVTTGELQYNFSKTGYYGATTTANLSALETNNASFEVYDHVLNLTLESLGATERESNFTVNIYSDDYSYSETRSTTTGQILANLTDGNYTVYLNDSVHVFTSYNVTLNSSTNQTNYVMEAFNINTLVVNFFDLDTLAVINNVNLSAQSSVATYSFTTSNGTISQDLLNPSSYKLTATSSTYDPSIVYVTLNDDNQTVNMYLDQSLTELLINVQSTLGEDVDDATVTITYNINGSFVTVYQAKTDAFGQSTVELDPNKDYFITVTHPEYATFEGSFSAIGTTYTVALEPASAQTYQSIFDLANFDVSFLYNNASEAIFTYDTVSSDGAIQWFAATTNYNGVPYSTNVTSSSGGGTITLNITGANASIQDSITYTIYLKVNGRETYTESYTYRLSETNPLNTTIRGGLTQSPASEMTSAGKAILGTFIVLFFVAAVFGLSGSLTAAAITGALITGGLAVGTWALFNPIYAVITVVVLLVTALGDAA